VAALAASALMTSRPHGATRVQVYQVFFRNNTPRYMFAMGFIPFACVVVCLPVLQARGNAEKAHTRAQGRGILRPAFWVADDCNLRSVQF